MTTAQAIFLGIVQGITEWLPISSSGHLVLLQNWLGTEQPIALDVVLHLGSLAAVLVLFRKDIIELFTRRRDMGLLVLLASIPTGIAGLLLAPFVERAFHSNSAVAAGLAATGAFLMLTRNRTGKKAIGWKDALLMGTMQGAAIFPGVSRSGATISAALFRGVDREQAARFSFLLFIPAILGATLLQAGSIMEADPVPLVAGGLAAMAVSFAAIGLLLKIVRQGRLHLFAWYCWALAIGISFL